MNRELPDVQAGFRKGRGTRDQIPNIRWVIEKAREFQKNIYFCFINYAKAFDYVDYNEKQRKSILNTETPILCPLHVKNWLIGKDPDAGKDWKQEKGMTEDEMVGWHHWPNGLRELVMDREAWHV